MSIIGEFDIRNRVDSGIDIFTESSSFAQVAMNMPTVNQFGSRSLIGEMHQAFATARPREYIDSIVIPCIYCRPL